MMHEQRTNLCEQESQRNNRYAIQAIPYDVCTVYLGA